MKPGFQTSEFWLSTFGAIWGVVSPLLPGVSVVQTMVPALAGAAYAIARAWTKAAHATAAGTALAPGATPTAVANLHLGG